MRILRRSAVAALAGAVTLGLTGCGSHGSLLSQGAAAQLTAELSQAQSALAGYDCAAADSALTNFRNDLGQLPGLDPTLAGMLDQGASTVTTLADRRCPSGGATTTTTTSTDTTTTQSSTRTHTAATTTTATEPTDTTTTATAPSDTNTTGGAGVGSGTATQTVTTVTVPASGGAGLGGNGDGGNGG